MKLINNLSILQSKKRNWLKSHDIGYNKKISSKQIKMIVIGGSIGTGLFLGSSTRLKIIGPSLAIDYLICGIFAFFILRALGELILHRPSSGNFVSYAREFLGEKISYIVGWLYFLNWAMTGIVDITAISLYMKYWKIFYDIPQWIFALIILIFISYINIIGVKWFAEIEFWLTSIKVLAITIFLIIAIITLFNGLSNNTTGLQLIINNGGFFPNGFVSSIILMQGVIFSFSSIELIGTTAGECKNPKYIIPKAINHIIWIILLFYIGSITLLILIIPWYDYKIEQSPFITFFSKIGFFYAGTIMNIVIISAAISSLNAGLYSTGRILRSMSMVGSAPKLMSKMNKKNVPYVGILITTIIYLIGVLLNYHFPSKVFELSLNIASLGIISSWFVIIMCQIKLRKEIKKGRAKDINFKMPFYPFTSWLTLIFLIMILVLMAFDYPNGTYTVASIPLIIALLMIGWFIIRKKVNNFNLNK